MSQVDLDTHKSNAAVLEFPGVAESHPLHDARFRVADSDTQNFAVSHVSVDTQFANATADNLAEVGADHAWRDDQYVAERTHSLLEICASTYESIQALRKAQNNRLRCWVRGTLPHEVWAHCDFSDEAIATVKGLPPRVLELLELLNKAEKVAENALKYEIRNHPLWPWLKNVRGVSHILGARLLKRLGDVRRFPNVAKLWMYCGLAGDQWRAKKEDGSLKASPRLRSICWLISEQFQRTPAGGSVYRAVYDTRKEYERSKPPCPKCAAAGATETCRPIHTNLRTRRYVVKRFLADLWEVAHGKV